jgi:signal peptidase I
MASGTGEGALGTAPESVRPGRGSFGDHIMVDKLRHSVRRGDVVVFEYPPDPRFEYVKRVVGLPGDVVEIALGRLSINGALLPRERYQDECPQGPDGATIREDATPCVLWHETLDGRTYDIGTLTEVGEGRDFAATVVPAGAVFVLGDNRDITSDSRVWGSVPVENVKGVARFVWWSTTPSWSERGRRGKVRWERVDALVR